MGRRFASILADLPPDDAAILEAYIQALREAGVSDRVFACNTDSHRTPESAGSSSLGNRVAAVHRFLKHPGLHSWLALPVVEQVSVLLQRDPVGLGARNLIMWLALTNRQPLPTGFLEALEARAPTPIRWLEHGRLALPDLVARLTTTTSKLGYCTSTVGKVSHDVMRTIAYLGKPITAISLDELVALSDVLQQRQAARRAQRGKRLLGHHEHQPLIPWTTGTLLFHAGLWSAPPDSNLIGRRQRQNLEQAQLGYLHGSWPHFYDVVTRYLARRSTLRTPATVKTETLSLGEFFRYLTHHHPEVTELRQLDRLRHIEPFLRWVLEEAGRGRARGQDRWTRATQVGTIHRVHNFFHLISAWAWPEAPSRPLFFPGDAPRLPEPLPQAFDDVDAARMVHLARTTATPIERLIIELLSTCGLRVGEARDLKLSDLVSFGGTAGQPAAQPWLRVPLGKLANDRYVPVGVELQAALDAFLKEDRSSREWDGLAVAPPWSSYLLARKGRRISSAYCNRVVQHIAERAGVSHAHAHRWRHTFATQAINRGMDLASIATLLGHRCLEMTMLYARIANPRLRQEFERISQQVQAFYTVVAADPSGADGPVSLPAGALGPAMVTTRREMEWRRLGNGWCTRRAYVDCRYELICERCVHFNTDGMFLPILQAQHADAVQKGQQARIELFGKLVDAIAQGDEQSASLPLVSGTRVADFSNPANDPKKGNLA